MSAIGGNACGTTLSLKDPVLSDYNIAIARNVDIPPPFFSKAPVMRPELSPFLWDNITFGSGHIREEFPESNAYILSDRGLCDNMHKSVLAFLFL